MENTKKKSRKKWVIIGAVIVVAVLFICTILVIFSRNDVRFKLESILGLNRTKVEVKEVKAGEIETSLVNVSELEGIENVELNQSLMLINTKNTLSENFEADVSEYKDTGVLMNSCIVNDYGKMSADIVEKFGVKLFVMSSFRTASEQEEISDEQGGDTAQVSGASEHQSGLALDVYVTGFAGEGFLKSDVGKWVNENCWKYGFIVRYGYGKSDVTGINFEPWHIRFVGFPHAEIMYQNNLSLEEYFDSLEDGKFYSYGDYVFSRQSGEDLEIPSDCGSVVISSDNAGGYVITGTMS